MSSKQKLRRSLPRPTDAIRIDKEALETQYDPKIHTMCKCLKDYCEKNDDWTEIRVIPFIGIESSQDKYIAMNCELSDNYVRKFLQEVSSCKIKKPFEKKTVVHSYYIDSISYSVETYKHSTTDKNIRCWDERCVDVQIHDGLFVAATVVQPLKAHSFPSKSNIHHDEIYERLTIEMGSGVRLVLDNLEQNKNRIKLTISKNDFKFPYKTVISALSCIMKIDL
ncbi:hypothetical protein TetV_218 [Tetraselmis virus 1]|uniref:Uncharacterized protein n=1 Tax=Tetraselmis virus 1 TaxID=2060617 RepID=A0A2P0VN59_9VIRU|nr:hypothetical protein QJ968_gp218 [Tetraselmis virus 1]AUF82310.1 hypothetical protein TetV_218 [Tetraselmis virus 1]